MTGKAKAQDQQQGPQVRRGQEGSRWVNYRPSGAEVRDWFANNVPIEPELKTELGIDRYVTGVTLIQSSEKQQAVIGFAEDTGLPMWREERHVVYTPYIRVDTRLLYFYDLCKLKGWHGSIIPVDVMRVDNPESAYFNAHLPKGFFVYRVKRDANQVVTFIGCSMIVTIFGEDESLLMSGPSGTKIVPVLGRYDVDENAVMKAETGAIGRALGAAGILIAPGSGIASAEDVAESVSSQGTRGVDETSAETGNGGEPSNQTSNESLRTHARALIDDLRSNHPAEFAEFSGWAQSRSFSTLTDVGDHELKGFVKKLEEQVDKGQRSGARPTSVESSEVALTPADKPAEPAA